MTLSVVQRILLGFVLLLVLIFVVAGSGIWGFNNVQQRIDVVTGDAVRIADQSNALADNLAKASSSILQYLLAKNDAALDSALDSFNSDKDEFAQQAEALEQSVADQPDILASIATITTSAEAFFSLADQAATDHARNIELLQSLPERKLDLKDAVMFAIEDLTMLAEFADSEEQAFAAKLATTQMEIVQQLIGDYFDSTTLAALSKIQGELNRALPPVLQVLNKLNDEDIAASIRSIEQSIRSDDGVVTAFYEYNQLVIDSEQVAVSVSEQLVAMQAQQYQLLEQVTELRDAAKASALNASDNAKRISMIVVAISVVVAALVAYTVSKSIRTPLAQILSVLYKIAEGDFTQRVKVSSKDEFGRLAASVNTLVEKLAAVIRDINAASNDVVQSAHEMEQSTTRTQAAMAAQSSKTNDAANAMSAMTSAVQEVAHHAEVTLDKVHQVDQRTQDSVNRMQANIQQVGELVQQLEQSAAVVNKVNDHSQSIGSILQVIEEIAEQTNLLALNAAIEAARAGEQGRGFAVVADEVRTLANRTQSSTEEIQAVIQALQDGVRSTVTTMEQSRERARRSMDEAEQVGATLTSLHSLMNEIRALSRDITTSAEQQTHMAHEINNSIHNISTSAQGTMAEAEQTQANCVKMNQVAERQQQLVAQFQV
ncbi:methyl-accepting chemotaxis protein [Maribrevibacterium harenarium]|uniref:Methyl-accepting chemotaxis protein n=1 Tax=Maribrevibacterium harenarium TaxID=2589817 RepID=A0A501WWN5_9GAMM|nr:methyl-accepting chemotaxis protein [Maribrevibacterium harenarium]TPE54123.1 methyl-accepting chemotaxis protein [Maribrevibacterium harenarium]